MSQSQQHVIKWREVLSLCLLNISIVISWIAYHEYQPILLDKMELSELSVFLVWAKSIVLVLVPIIAGVVADYLFRKHGKYFVVFMIGISLTALIFMIVASIISGGQTGQFKDWLPLMIVLWLVSMNIFISPAYSMLEAFAPANRLPLVMGVLFLMTELTHALKPLVVELVSFFGDTLTFIVGGILIGGSGFLFFKVSSKNVISYRKSDVKKSNGASFKQLFVIVLIGLVLGFGKAILVNYVPFYLPKLNGEHLMLNSGYVSFFLLGGAAIIGFLLSQFFRKSSAHLLLVIGVGITIAGLFGALSATQNIVFLIWSGITALGFSFMNIAGIPYALQQLSFSQVTYGIGLFIGASEIMPGIFELFFT